MRAFDELRFGPHRTLNLREALPSSTEAIRRAENWLREHQVKGSEEVLIVTGRGLHSVDGVPVIRPAIEKLLFALRRGGVIASHAEHNPGAFVVHLAPLRALVEAPARNRDIALVKPAPASIHGLDAVTTDLLRQVAELSLDALGIDPDEATIRDEMHRFLGAILRGLPTDDRREQQLVQALRAAIAEFD